MLKFYGDETGIDSGSRICAVAGLVGTEKQWGKFDRDWMKVLNAEDIAYFHAVDCERGKDEFYGLDVMKRGRIVDNLVGIITKSSLKLYSYGLVRPHFEAWPEDDRKHFTDGNPNNPYYLCLSHLFVCSSHVADGLDTSEKIEYVFEKQDEFEPEARRIFGDLRVGPLWKNHVRLGEIFFSEQIEKYPGMQAADLIAYETFRHLDNKHFQPKLRTEWKTRIAMRVLQSKFPDNVSYFDADGLAKLTAIRANWNYDTMTERV